LRSGCHGNWDTVLIQINVEAAEPPILWTQKTGRTLTHLPYRANSGKGVPLMATDSISNEDKTPALSHAKPVSVPALRPAKLAPAPKRRFWLWMVSGLMAVVLVAVGYTQVWMTGPPVVTLEVARMAPVTRLLAVNGRIAAVNSVDIRPVVTGGLTAIAVSEGDLVQTGQILAQVDAAAQNANVRQAAAGLDAALVTQQQAIEGYERALALGPRIATAVLETNAHVVQTAAQDVARQSAALEQAQVILANHTIRAPRAGTIVALEAELGQLASPTTPLLTLADLSDLVVEADVDEAYATQIAVGQPAVLQLAGEANNRDGRISFVSALVDVATGGLAVKISFDDPVLAPIGLTVATNIIVESRAAALSVPRTALRTDADGTGILKVRDDRAVFQPVKVVDWPAARLIVTAGLAEGDVVITDPTGVESGQFVVSDQP
jgi:RND family efflux transporter MFP subunit